MRNKGIAIELTALLDVILIMLFWVMLNMERENERVKTEAAEQAAAYEQQVAEMSDELDTVRSDHDRLQTEFDRYVSENSESIAAANQKALDEFAEGRMITLNLTYDAVGKLYILGEDDVILCALVYDGDRALYSDVKLITAAADDVGRKYNNFYCTYINISR